MRRAPLSGQRLLGGPGGQAADLDKSGHCRADTLLMVFCDDTGTGALGLCFGKSSHCLAQMGLHRSPGAVDRIQSDPV